MMGATPLRRPVRSAIALLGLLAALLAGLPTRGSAQEPAAGPEEIVSYDVSIDVQDDGWLEVTERIRVRAAGDRIRRGIYRDFPTTFPREAGAGRIEAPFEVVAVERDGQAEPYLLQSVGGPARRGGVRVRIGDPDVLLEPGEHTYAITYRTLRWIRYGEERDEHYWNVTGNGWDFGIASASATVRLPAPLDEDEVRLEGWTGPEGSTRSALTSALTAADAAAGGAAGDALATFRTTEALGPREGLTVRLTFPKGVVAPPSDAQRAQWFRMDWAGWIDAALVLALVLAVYVLLWIQVGRDPRGQTPMVRYEPPPDFTPARLGYVMDRGPAGRQLTAGVVDLAVRGWIGIEYEGAGLSEPEGIRATKELLERKRDEIAGEGTGG